MVSFEEAEWSLVGRIKSVLLLALAVTLLAQYGGSARLAAESGEDNPIDAFYSGLEGEPALASEGGARILTLLYLESWEQEFLHAYDCLRERSSALYGDSGLYAETAREAFAGYADAAGWLEAMTAAGTELPASVEFVDFAPLEKDLPASAEGASMLPVEKARVQAELYREQTLRIYRLLSGEASAVRPGLFQFDSEAARGELRRCGL